MRTKAQIAIATFLALAVLLALLTPLIFSPPAPRHRTVPPVALFAGASAATVAMLAPAAVVPRAEVTPLQAIASPDLLNLLCTRLC